MHAHTDTHAQTCEEIGKQTDMQLDRQTGMQQLVDRQAEKDAAGEVNPTQCGPDTKARSLLLSDHLPAAQDTALRPSPLHTHSHTHTQTHTHMIRFFNRLDTK